MTLALLTGMTTFGQNNTEKSTNKGFAVLELFTSEGCSSCPPADALMGMIQKENKDNNVYVLSYHVDYWDKQGWKDIFSNPEYTKRQYTYSDWLGISQIYTPQVIINGKTQLIGSQETAVRTALKNALAKPASTELSLTAIQIDNSITINYKISSITKGSSLLLAIVQKSAVSNVKRGENAHRVLNHFQIVHQLKTIALTASGSGKAKINLPKGFNTTDFEIIGFVQNNLNGSILGANKADFNSNL